MDCAIRTDHIRLSQLMKLAGMVDDGVAAKHAVLQGQVRVNGVVEMRRGRKIRDGDSVEFVGRTWTVRSER